MSPETTLSRMTSYIHRVARQPRVVDGLRVVEQARLADAVVR
jgi:hypothetical protein